MYSFMKSSFPSSRAENEVNRSSWGSRSVVLHIELGELKCISGTTHHQNTTKDVSVVVPCFHISYYNLWNTSVEVEAYPRWIILDVWLEIPPPLSPAVLLSKVTFSMDSIFYASISGWDSRMAHDGYGRRTGRVDPKISHASISQRTVVDESQISEIDLLHSVCSSQ